MMSIRDRIEEEFSAIRWHDDSLWLLDQRLLPREEQWLRCDSVTAVVDAIRDMVVRGAPAIGITAAYGVVVALQASVAEGSQTWREDLAAAHEQLAASRPTAVNLAWALTRMQKMLSTQADDLAPVEPALEEARAIHYEDIMANKTMGALGADYIRAVSERGQAHVPGVLTHCNTGALATGGYGTALGVIRSAFRESLFETVFADETRPWLQGSRLTAWELQKEGIPVVLNADSAAATLMAAGKVSWVIVGADRIASNGDVANKIGTYALAVLARHHGVKFMVAAPCSTLDMALTTGQDIPIEQRGESELCAYAGVDIAPHDIQVYNPVFDVTPAEWVDAIVTERGVIEAPDSFKIESMLKR